MNFLLLLSLNGGKDPWLYHEKFTYSLSTKTKFGFLFLDNENGAVFLPGILNWKTYLELMKEITTITVNYNYSQEYIKEPIKQIGSEVCEVVPIWYCYGLYGISPLNGQSLSQANFM